jgi:hypothetical protein
VAIEQSAVISPSTTPNGFVIDVTPSGGTESLGWVVGNVLDLWSTFLERCQRTNCNWSYPQIQNTT